MSRSNHIKRRRRSRGRARNKLLLTFGVFVSLLAIAGLSVVGYVVSLANDAPSLDSIKPKDPGSLSRVYAADGSPLGFIQNDELRQVVAGRRFPKVLRDATVAIEDERFYKHKGVDFEGVIRAAIKNLKSGKTIQGGSTITMQVIRNLYISKERTFKRKLHEAKLAEELEDEIHDKNKILDLYLNTVPYGTTGGQTAIGAQAAARMYFGKSVEDLKLHEAALLAGLPQAPSQYSPFKFPEKAIARRNDVIRNMAKQGYVTQDQAAAAMRHGTGVKPSRFYRSRRESYFFDYVKDELIRKYGAQEVKRGGLKIYTTIDLAKQKAARAAIASTLNQPGDPSSAIVTIDHRTGDIVAMASSSDYGKSKFNLAAQGHRQPGSTFKVMALMTALRRGVDPDKTGYVSHTLNIKDPVWGDIKTKTYDGSERGYMNLTQATLRSDNTVYMQLGLDLGPDQVKKTAQDMGIVTKLDGYPAETLGGLTIGVSPLEITDAYGTIADGGWRRRPIAIRKVVFPDGHSEMPYKRKKTKVFDDSVTGKATEILIKNIQGGTGTKANIGCPAGGKTGTTDKHNDAWFVGFTPRLVTGVWVGYPNAQVQMLNVHGITVAGGTFPAEIWAKYMKVAKGRYCGDFKKPTHPFEAQPFFGKYARTGSKEDKKFDQFGTQDLRPGAAPTPGADDGGKDKGDDGGKDKGGGNGNGNGNGGGNGKGNNGNGNGNGGGNFDPELYESPPQGSPGGADPGAAPAPGDG